VLPAELRGIAGDVATLAIDAADAPKLDTDTRYRLVTLPVEDRPDREFASLLRAADETMARVEVGEGSAVAGRAVRDLGGTVVAIAHAGTDPATLPIGDRTLAAGDVLSAIGTPESLRKLERAAEPTELGAGDPAGQPVADEVRGGQDTNPADAPADSPLESADRPDEAGSGDSTDRSASPGTLFGSPPRRPAMQWRLFATLAQTAGTDTVPVDGDAASTVGEALDALVERHPDLREEVVAGGGLQDHIRLLVDGQDPFREADGLETPVEENTELALFPPVSGG